MKYNKLYPILFESEEYFKHKTYSSGKLNTEKAKKFFNFYKDDNKYFYYEPNGLTQEAAENSSEPNNRGLLLPKPNAIYHQNNSFISVDLEKQQIIFHPLSSIPLQDPRVAYQLTSLMQVFPEFNSFSVVEQVFNDKTGKNSFKSLGTLENVLSKKKELSGQYKEYNRDEITYKEYKFEVLQDITEIDWYHATRRSNWSAIKKFGLLPSKEFLTPQQHGWTFLNMHLQNAVYLTLKKDYAQEIAETLADKYEEPAIVLKINGSALKDKSKIVVDEDALRNEYTDVISGNATLPGMPEFYTSILHNISSVGYSETISPSEISIVSKVEWNKPEKD